MRDFDWISLDIEETKKLISLVDQELHNPMIRTLGGMPAACRMKRDLERDLALMEAELRELKNSVRGESNGEV